MYGRLEVAAERHYKLAHLAAAIADRFGPCYIRRWQIAPHSLKFAHWADFVGFVGQCRPNRGEVFGADYVGGGDVGQRCRRLAERRPMLESPGREKIVGIIG